jgi:hypothetical protein
MLVQLNNSYMGRLEIVEKLNKFSNKHMPFTEESQVVYLLVEIRKILDRDNNHKYPLLRFYCDWSVHTEKDRITKEMRGIMAEIYADVANQIIQHPLPVTKKTKVISFMYMEDLQVELQQFLKEYSLPDSLTSNKDNWLAFVKLLVKVLADQPINEPCDGIKTFAFLPAAEGCVLGRIDFTDNINGYDHYDFGNAY